MSHLSNPRASHRTIAGGLRHAGAQRTIRLTSISAFLASFTAILAPKDSPRMEIGLPVGSSASTSRTSASWLSQARSG